MTSEPHGPTDEQRPPPAWAGDVAVGVEAWTRGAQRDEEQPGQRREQRGRRQGRGRAGRGRSEGRRRTGPRPPDPVAELPEADQEEFARKILLDQLTGQARSRQQLAEKLRAKNVPEPVATRLLDRFEEVGLIDDEAFARMWVSHRGAGAHRGLATRALAAELRRKGVEDQVVKDALEDVDPEEERETARRLVRGKLRSVARVDDTTATRRLVGMLARKGYGSGVAFAVVREELAAAGRDEPDPDPDL
ncbi:regulatory protein RecX [Nocardioides nanhaiensis]|uniref:Regulatory protein RecX n=1 Tax=Nocardioides nanhaiensis TaxID=1476871 RepID=A0ABP8X363_9ACTN